MSGTSLDGLDLCAARFFSSGSKRFEILAAETLPYPEFWQEALGRAHALAAPELLELHAAYGRYLGETVIAFEQRHRQFAELIASHGHTVHHRPEAGFSFQLGDPAHLMAVANRRIVADFRQADVALGGQGAPLIPRVDQLLFSEYDAFLNLGGIANASIRTRKEVVGFDICPFNQVLNHLARRLGEPYDNGGSLARTGSLQPELLERLEALDFYRRTGPRSLGREETEAWYLPALSLYEPPDALRTCVRHFALRIKAALGSAKTTLITGGGAYNRFFLEELQELGVAFHLPEPDLIEYKEALGFAFLGWLRVNGKNGALGAVTGAKRDHPAGQIWEP